MTLVSDDPHFSTCFVVAKNLLKVYVINYSFISRIRGTTKISAIYLWETSWIWPWWVKTHSEMNNCPQPFHLFCESFSFGKIILFCLTNDIWSNSCMGPREEGYMHFQAKTVIASSQQRFFTSQTPQFIDRRKWFQEESASADCGRTDGLMGVAGNGCGNIPTATRLTLELNLRPIHSANNQPLQFLIPPCRIPIHWHKPWFHSPLPWIEPTSHSRPNPLTHYKSPWFYLAQL